MRAAKESDERRDENSGRIVRASSWHCSMTIARSRYIFLMARGELSARAMERIDLFR